MRGDYIKILSFDFFHIFYLCFYSLCFHLGFYLKKRGVKMAYREPVKAALDKKVFKNTARSTKLINVSPKQMRGGIRL